MKNCRHRKLRRRRNILWVLMRPFLWLVELPLLIVLLLIVQVRKYLAWRRG